MLVWILSANYDIMGDEARLRAEQRMERDFYEDGFHASAPQKACIFSPGWLENVVARAQGGVLQLANQKAEHPKRGTPYSAEDHGIVKRTGSTGIETRGHERLLLRFMMTFFFLTAE